eukprot:GHUV01005164.1.p1 GENE.GHUV01005164.1~~GHUV01005164.1.p1  ORF type:complete len:259 (+),score=70.17 GHUV01005164.1:183-959(+)
MQVAAIINKCGGPDVIELVHNHPIPSRSKGQVLVRVKSTSVNPVDTAVRSGRVAPKKFPKVLGGDIAGIVEAADPGSRFKAGDHVAALTPGYWIDQEGTYCQYVVTEESWLAKVPRSVDLGTAGGLPLVGLTAWQALMAAAPTLGQRVLITQSSGGVGHVAVQLAKALGLYVVAVAGPSNASWVKQSLGADEVVDYSKDDFVVRYKKSHPFDIVVDMLPKNQVGYRSCSAAAMPYIGCKHSNAVNSRAAKLQAASIVE